MVICCGTTAALQAVNWMQSHSGTVHDGSATAHGVRHAEAGALEGTTVQQAGKEGGKALPLNSLPTMTLSTFPVVDHFKV